MKLTFIFILSIFLLSCGNTAAPKGFKKQKSDTTLTTVLYGFNVAANDYRIVTVNRITLDTFAMVSVDAETQKRRMVRDSLYFIMVVDTLRNDKGNPLVDSLGKPKIEQKIYGLPKEYILQDFNKTWGKVTQPK